MSDYVQRPFFKITNKNENHYGYQYVTGLNVLDKPFDEGSCMEGGLYFSFSDIEHIFEFLHYGVYLREIILPLDDPDFKCVKDLDNKWRANKIILGKRHELNISIFSYLISLGLTLSPIIPMQLFGHHLREIWSLLFF